MAEAVRCSLNRISSCCISSSNKKGRPASSCKANELLKNILIVIAFASTIFFIIATSLNMSRGIAYITGSLAALSAIILIALCCIKRNKDSLIPTHSVTAAQPTSTTHLAHETQSASTTHSAPDTHPTSTTHPAPDTQSASIATEPLVHTVNFHIGANEAPILMPAFPSSNADTEGNRGVRFHDEVEV
jgi:hypothetical protein